MIPLQDDAQTAQDSRPVPLADRTPGQDSVSTMAYDPDYIEGAPSGSALQTIPLQNRAQTAQNSRSVPLGDIEGVPPPPKAHPAARPLRNIMATPVGRGTLMASQSPDTPLIPLADYSRERTPLVRGTKGGGKEYKGGGKMRGRRSLDAEFAAHSGDTPGVAKGGAPGAAYGSRIRGGRGSSAGSRSSQSSQAGINSADVAMEILRRYGVEQMPSANELQDVLD